MRPQPPSSNASKVRPQITSIDSSEPEDEPPNPMHSKQLKPPIDLENLTVEFPLNTQAEVDDSVGPGLNRRLSMNRRSMRQRPANLQASLQPIRPGQVIVQPIAKPRGSTLATASNEMFKGTPTMSNKPYPGVNQS